MVGPAAACGDASIGRPPALEYRAAFLPLNGSGVSGRAEFRVDLADDEFRARVDADGLAPGVVHLQHVHLSATCPTAADDANGDGFVDLLEGLPVHGPILLPLDDVLTVQVAGEFPTAGGNGEIDYRAEARLSSVLGDLRREDPDPADILVKLGSGEGLALENRTVVLHGVSPGAGLPESVGTPAGTDAHATLPVACGEINQIR